MPLGGSSKKIDCEFYNASCINDASQPLPRVQTCGLVFQKKCETVDPEGVEEWKRCALHRRCYSVPGNFDAIF
jgi:hypothetical protein